jgi:hypothetical protein
LLTAGANAFEEDPDWHRSSAQPSALFAETRTIVDQLREMLYVEELKLAIAASKSDAVSQVFRWSGRRKLAIRARNLRLWCDLRDEMADSPCEDHTAAAFNMIACLAIRSFDRAIFEEEYYIDQASFRFSTMFLAEVEANLRRQKSPFAYEDDSQPPSTAQDMALKDDRRFDMLWIYSVGAHIEHNQAESRKKQPSMRPAETMVAPFTDEAPRKQQDSWSNGPFSARFSKLVKILGFRHFEDVAQFLEERYIYCRRLQDEGLRRLVVHL